MSIRLTEHARLVLTEFASLRDQDGFISPIASTEMLDRLDQSRRAGKNLGNVASLLDAACAKTDLPWIGRLILFSKPDDDFVDQWGFWAPFKVYIVERAPRARNWIDSDFRAIDEVLDSLPRTPQQWWDACEDREALLRRVLSVTLKHAHFRMSSQSAA